MLHKMLSLLLCISWLFAVPAQANTFDFNTLSKIPVMHEGRIKPMDSFARALHKKFSGTDDGAMIWLVETLFNPAHGETIPILKISNPDVLNMLALEHRKNKLFSYKETSDALAQKQVILLSILKSPKDEWTPAQRDFVLLQESTVMLGDLLSSMSLFLPLSIVLPPDVPERLETHTGKKLSYLDVLEFESALQDAIKDTIKNKGQVIETYTDAEQALAYLNYTMDNLKTAGARSTIFKVLPQKSSDLWFSPWQIVLDRSEHERLEHWKNMALAFHSENTELWSTSLSNIQKNVSTNIHVRNNIIETEFLYNRINPFYISTLLYGLSVLVLVLYVYLKSGLFLWLSALSSLSGALVHLTGITTRMYILDRPPVSTLYESIIFVGLIAALYGLITFLRHKDSLWLFIGAGTACTLQIIGFSFDQDGDNLMMLTAVLNTNFWLATHVICITMGYAFCIITSVLAHYILIFHKNYKDALFKQLHTAALIALMFSAVGTVLGGIWADQSWGRFWGWDPKENGALLIVIWLIWVLHGRISGQMGQTMMTAGLAYLSVIVALSWFGVNLLSVGLHAYGFTDSAAWTLSLFVTAETIIIGWLLWQRKDKGVIP